MNALSLENVSGLQLLLQPLNEKSPRILETYLPIKQGYQDSNITPFDLLDELLRFPCTMFDTNMTINAPTTSSITLFNHQFDAQRGNVCDSQSDTSQITANQEDSITELTQDHYQHIGLMK